MVYAFINSEVRSFVSVESMESTLGYKAPAICSVATGDIKFVNTP